MTRVLNLTSALLIQLCAVNKYDLIYGLTFVNPKMEKTVTLLYGSNRVFFSYSHRTIQLQKRAIERPVYLYSTEKASHTGGAVKRTNGFLKKYIDKEKVLPWTLRILLWISGEYDAISSGDRGKQTLHLRSCYIRRVRK